MEEEGLPGRRPPSEGEVGAVPPGRRCHWLWPGSGGKRKLGLPVELCRGTRAGGGVGGELSAASPGRAPEVRDGVGLSSKLEPRGPGGSQAGPQRATGMEVSLVTLNDEARPGAGPEGLHHLLPPAQDQDCLPRHHTEFLCLR